MILRITAVLTGKGYELESAKETNGTQLEGGPNAKLSLYCWRMCYRSGIDVWQQYP